MSSDSSSFHNPRINERSFKKKINSEVLLNYTQPLIDRMPRQIKKLNQQLLSIQLVKYSDDKVPTIQNLNYFRAVMSGFRMFLCSKSGHV